MKRLPKLPSAVYSTIGYVPVELVPDLMNKDKEPCLGTWSHDHRIIKLNPEQPLVTGWQTLIHEKVHMWLGDAGVSGTLTNKQEEAICDAISTAIVAEMLHSKK